MPDSDRQIEQAQRQLAIIAHLLRSTAKTLAIPLPKKGLPKGDQTDERAGTENNCALP